jgi:hypothetical protein
MLPQKVEHLANFRRVYTSPWLPMAAKNSEMAGIGQPWQQPDFQISSLSMGRAEAKGRWDDWFSIDRCLQNTIELNYGLAMAQLVAFANQ